MSPIVSCTDFSLLFADPESVRVTEHLNGTSASSSALDERALVARVRDGDVRALEALFRMHADALAEFAYHYVRSDALAQDVVQDVFIKFWDRRETLDIHGKVAGYLFRAVRNRALNVAEHERLESRVQAVAAHESGVALRTTHNDGDVAIEADEFATRVRDALDTLPPRCKEIFLLHREEGMTYQEIAAALGIGLPTIHNQMSRATKRLIELLRDENV
jgi:RNA polymerase sigma-70 factor (ECF subfamily)